MEQEDSALKKGGGDKVESGLAPILQCLFAFHAASHAFGAMKREENKQIRGGGWTSPPEKKPGINRKSIEILASILSLN